MKTLIIIFLILLLLPVFSLFAQTKDECDPKVAFCNPVPTTNKSISAIVGTVIKTVLGIIGSLALVLFIAAGFIWMTAKGEAAKIKKATDIMFWAAIGLVVIFSSYALLSFVFGVIK